MKVFIAVIVTFVVTALLVSVGIGVIKARGKTDAEVVQVRHPERGDLTEFIRAQAEVQPETHVSIQSRVAARVAELPYEEGQAVSKGDPDAEPPVEPSVLVRLDADDLEAALASAEANAAASQAQIEVEQARIAAQEAAMKGTEASLAQARSNLARREKVLQDVTALDLDNLRCRVEELSAQLESTRDSIRAAELNLEVLQHHLEAAEAAIAQARDRLTYT
ncbi:MAG: biotin/lipoyl-binding protein, partial [Planctomycetes bacterium]|nr:biotin/lipoyl-binding protein [Planctomycetota bacterium]